MASSAWSDVLLVGDFSLLSVSGLAAERTTAVGQIIEGIRHVGRPAPDTVHWRQRGTVMLFTGLDHTATTRASRLARQTDPELHHALVPVAHPGSLENIVVPLDGTDFSEHAIPLAIAIAKRSGGVLKLVRAFTPTDTMALHPGLDAFQLVEAQLRSDARQYLDNLQRRIAARASDVTVITHLAEARNIVEVVGRISRTADLVVMATHGRGWFRRLFQGSLGRDMLRHRHKPIIYVRGYNSPVDFSADPIPRHLAIALSGRKASEQALDAAEVLTGLVDARSTLLHVDDPRQDDERFAQASPEIYLGWIGRKLARVASEVATHVVREAASPTDGILSFVDESGADLVAVTTRTAPPAFRSTTENLIRKCPVPVLVVRE
jgi:nucleotide-binding universal stress UspA family protein